MESSYECDVLLTIESEQDPQGAPSVFREFSELDDFDEAVHTLRGIFFGTLFSIPIWAFILWIVF
jgi:hypothetical protein